MRPCNIEVQGDDSVTKVNDMFLSGMETMYLLNNYCITPMFRLLGVLE
jgi:hypothetical protein